MRTFPKLLYIGDVPVEASYHGSALVYRLLQNYDRERLCVVEIAVNASRPDRRLPEVPYHHFRPWFSRFQNRYLASLRAGLLLAAGPVRRRPALYSLAKSFAPEAILSVSHGSSWLEAAELAKALHIPLHSICHDDWLTTLGTPKLLYRAAEALFKRNYRASATRLCVSPFMESFYKTLCGVPGRVLYPSQAVDSPHFSSPPERLLKAIKSPVIAFAGSVSDGYIELFNNLALVLKQSDGKLLIFGPTPESVCRQNGLVGDNIEFIGLLSSRDLIEVIRKSADAVYCPISFLESNDVNSKIAFPSKLTDYTAVGLPVIIQAPANSSAITWADENCDSVISIEDRSIQSIQDAVNSIIENPSYAYSLGMRALEIGRFYFGAKRAEELFFADLVIGSD